MQTQYNLKVSLVLYITESVNKKEKNIKILFSVEQVDCEINFSVYRS